MEKQTEGLHAHRADCRDGGTGGAGVAGSTKVRRPDEVDNGNDIGESGSKNEDENTEVKIGHGQLVSIMDYDDDEVLFHGLSSAAFDGDVNTYHQGAGVVTWDGDLTHKEIEITGRGAYNGDHQELYAHFLDAGGTVIKAPEMTNTEIRIGTSKEIGTVRVVVPEGATQLHFYASRGGVQTEYGGLMRIHDITVTK